MDKNKCCDNNRNEFARELDPNRNSRNEAAKENNFNFEKNKNNNKIEAADEFDINNKKYQNRLENDKEFNLDMDLEFNPQKQKVRNKRSRDLDENK